MLSSGRSLRECRRPEERWVATAVLLLILSCGIGWGEDNPGRKILTEWSELKGVEGFEDLEGIDDPAALDDLESIEDLEELEKLIGLEGLDLDLRMPTWDHEATLSGSIGYNDNPLLQPAGQDPEASGFWQTGVEFFLWRLPTDGTEFILMVDATDLRYFSTIETDGDQVAFLHGSWSWITADWSRVSLKAQAIYQDQVLDLSANELEPYIGPVEVLSSSVEPEWELTLTRDLSVSASGLIRTDRFQEGPDDFDDLGGRVGVGYRLKQWGELEIRYSAYTRDYATRVQYTAGGRPLFGTHLSVDHRETEARFLLRSVPDGGWTLRTKLGHLQFRDNGSGFFDYDRAMGGLELSWSPGQWRFTARGDYHRYDFLSQTVWTGRLENRLKEDTFASLRVERDLTGSLRWHLEGEWEMSRTNDVYGDYDAVSGSTGLAWSF